MGTHAIIAIVAGTAALWLIVRFGLFWLARALLRRWRPVARARHRLAERLALPDGTRVRLTCRCSGWGTRGHDGVWRTSWTPRRMGMLVDDVVDDYRLTREGDGEETYATRGVLEVVP